MKRSAYSMLYSTVFFFLTLISLPVVCGDLDAIAENLTADATDAQVHEAIDALQEEVNKLNKMIEEQKKSIKTMEKKNEEMKKRNANNESAVKKQRKLKKRKPLRNTRKTPPKKKKGDTDEFDIEEMKRQLDKNTLVIEDYSKYLRTMKKEIAKADAKIKELRKRETYQRNSVVKPDELKKLEEDMAKQEGNNTKEGSKENLVEGEDDAEEIEDDETIVNETNALPAIPTVYIGRVHASDWDKLEQKENVTLLHECIRWCGSIRNNEGNEWNVLEYRNDKMCFCNRNGSGWTENDDLIAYQFL